MRSFWLLRLNSIEFMRFVIFDHITNLLALLCQLFIFKCVFKKNQQKQQQQKNPLNLMKLFIYLLNVLTNLSFLIIW